ncbi:MAG: DedA family protein [bacterium]
MFEVVQVYLAEFTYGGIFFVLLLCGFGLPIPEDIPILTSGYLAHLGTINIWAALAVNFTGVMLGDIIIYSIGYFWGSRVAENRLFRSWMKPGRREKVERFFGRHGKKAIFFGRFAAGLRAPLFLMAGVMRMPAGIFLGMDILAASVSVPVLLFAAYYFGDEIDVLRNMVGKTQNFVLLIATATILWIALRYVRQYRKSKRADVAE